jgi:hypothetical protein
LRASVAIGRPCWRVAAGAFALLLVGMATLGFFDKKVLNGIGELGKIVG